MTDAPPAPGEPVVDVVVLGQTPPPVHGQAVMVEALLRLEHPDVRLHHVRFAFSDDLAAVGSLHVRKLVRLLRVLVELRRVQRATGAAVLYLAVGGASVVPLVRDALVVAAGRRRAQRVVLHVHGAGMAKAVDRLPRLARRVVLGVMGRPDVVIQLTPASPPDGRALRAREVVVIPNGIPDAPPAPHRQDDAFRLLALGTLRESKGHLVLVQALAAVRRQGIDARLTLVGAPASPAFAGTLADTIDELGLRDVVDLPGELTGADKLALFACHDVLAHPSWYENQSITVLEAMRAALPVAATRWPGADSLVRDGVTGRLVPVKDVDGLAQALVELAREPRKRVEMGRAGREVFLAEFTETRFHERMRSVLRGDVAAP